MARHKPTRPEPVQRQKPAGGEAQSVAIGGEPAPKLPHERDESSSHQGTEPRERIEQGRKDIEEGRVDTSKHEAMDAPYERQKERP